MGATRTALIFALSAALAACSQPELRSFSGYAQADYVRVAVPLSGSLAKLNVRRGETVRAGEPLFSLDSRDEQAAQRETMERVKAAQARLRTAQRSARADEIRVAQSNVDASQAELARLQWRLDQSVARAPNDGVIVDMAYSEGQWVEAGIGIVSLLSPQSLKVQFYVPAQVASTLHHGQEVGLRCSGCGQIAGQIVYVSPIAQAPGDGSMARLRFLVEARPAPSAALSLRPGQAVDVML